MKRLDTHERIWVLGLLAVALCLGVKSFWLDAWQPRNAEELSWAASVDRALAAEAEPGQQNGGLLIRRVVAVKRGGGEKAHEPGALSVTVRSYIGGYLPISDKKLIVPLSGEL